MSDYDQWETEFLRDLEGFGERVQAANAERAARDRAELAAGQAELDKLNEQLSILPTFSPLKIDANGNRRRHPYRVLQGPMQLVAGRWRRASAGQDYVQGWGATGVEAVRRAEQFIREQLQEAAELRERARITASYQRPDAPMTHAVYRTDDGRVGIGCYPPGVSYWDQALYLECPCPGRTIRTKHLTLLGEADTVDGYPSSSYPSASAIRDAAMRQVSP